MFRIAATSDRSSAAVTSLQQFDDTESGGKGTSLIISGASSILENAHLGDSICINGTCLTVTDLPSSDSFKVGIAPETLRRTNLGSLEQGSRVNLEPALLPNTRLGGHFLQGHVDTVATIVKKQDDGNAFTYRFSPRDKGVLRYIVEKGFIAIDGASLTVTAVSDNVEDGWFEIMLIAYSQEKVVMGQKGEGYNVNMEVDMVGKYVEKSVAGYFEGQGATGNMAALEKMVGRIVEQRLKA